MIHFVIHGERFMYLRGVFLFFKGKASSYALRYISINILYAVSIQFVDNTLE